MSESQNPKNTIMLGVGSIREHISLFYKTNLPLIIDAAREQWQVDDYMLPYPEKYDSYDPLTTNVYPTLGSLVTRTNDWNKVDINEFSEEVYEATYTCRIFVWVRTPQAPDGTWVTPEYDSALALRDSMMSMMRSLILHTPSLQSGGALRVEEGSLSEDYLDAMKSNDQSSRWMSGGIISVNIKQREANYAPRIDTATANTILVDGHHLDEGVTP